MDFNLEDMMYNIQKYWYRIISPFYDICHGILNIIRWIPTIYADRSDDDRFIYLLLYKKFSIMEKDFSKYDIHSGSNKVILKIKTIKNLCKRLSDHNYLENALVDYYKKYGEEYKNMAIEQKKEYTKAGLHSIKMERQDYNYLIKHLEKNLKIFWF